MYLDPGFGGMLLQIIVTIIAAGGATLFAVRKKIRALLNKNKEANNVSSITDETGKMQPQDDDDAIDMLSED